MRFGIMSLGAKKSNSLNSKNISRTFSNIFEIPKRAVSYSPLIE
jgi:hypothetical protein